VVPGEGDTVSAGQPVQFQITLTGSCPTPGIYTIRADLIDPGTSQVLATARGQLQANGQFIETLTESLLAPPSLGRWPLQLSVYILWSGSVVAPASQQTFGLTVVPYTATSTVAMTQTTMIESSSTTSSLQPTITQPSVTIFSSISSQSQMVAPTSGGFYTELQLAAAALVILVILVAFLMTRRKQAKKEETQVY
jgi:hypothetical protein